MLLKKKGNYDKTKTFFFEKEEGGSRGSSDSEGEIFSSSSAAEGERGNIYLNAIELFRNCRG